MPLKVNSLLKKANNLDKLVEEYKKKPSMVLRNEIVRELESVISYHVNQYKLSGISLPVLRAEAEKIAIDAIQAYKPGRSSFKTWVGQQMARLKRFVSQNQFIYIPEARRSNITGFQQAVDDLKKNLNREPTMQEIADYTRRPFSEVKKVLRETTPLIPSGKMTFDDIVRSGSKTSRIMNAIYMSLPPFDKLVFEYLYGFGGRQTTERTTDIANKLGVSPSAVSQAKKRISKQLEERLI